MAIAYESTSNVIGPRTGPSDFVGLLEVNVWVAMFLVTCAPEKADALDPVQAAPGRRFLRNVARGAELPDGRLPILACSHHIVRTAAHVLATKHGVNEQDAAAWILAQVKAALHEGRAVFDDTRWTAEALKAQRAVRGDDAAPDEEDQGVHESARTLNATIIGLDAQSQEAFEGGGGRWLAPRDALRLLPNV